MKIRQKDGGFTLVEAVVTVVIIGMAVLPLSAFFTSSLAKTKETQTQLVANQLVQACVEGVKAQKYEILKTFAQPTSPGGYPHEEQIMLDTHQLDTAGILDIPEGYEVTIGLWPEKSYEMGSYIHELKPESKPDGHRLYINGVAYVLEGQGKTYPSLTLNYSEKVVEGDKKLYIMTLQEEGKTFYTSTARGCQSKLVIPQELMSYITVNNQSNEVLQVEVAVVGETTPALTIAGDVSVDYVEYIAYEVNEQGGTQEITNHSDRIILPSGSIDKDKVGRAYKLVLYNNLPMTSSTTLDIYNQTNEVLEVEIRTGLAEAMGLKVQVKRGMVNKSYPAARAKKDRYSLYHLEVHVAEEKTGQELARIQTTKLD